MLPRAFQECRACRTTQLRRYNWVNTVSQLGNPSRMLDTRLPKLISASSRRQDKILCFLASSWEPQGCPLSWQTCQAQHNTRSSTPYLLWCMHVNMLCHDPGAVNISRHSSGPGVPLSAVGSIVSPRADPQKLAANWVSNQLYGDASDQVCCCCPTVCLGPGAPA